VRVDSVWYRGLVEEVKGEDKLRVHCPDHGFSETGTRHTRFNWDPGLREEVKGEDRFRVHCPDDGFSETGTRHTRFN
jgi:hypothetical protein